MNKRVDTIRSLFITPQSLTGSDEASPTTRVRSGAVRSLKESFSGVERENEELREKLAAARGLVELDPSSIAPSPVADRFATRTDPSFDALKMSISERGQEVPVLVRNHPTSVGRYQAAYGHRRIRAALELGIQVKAIVRELTDEELVVAQGLENSAREDLTFIERAMFASRLEDAGHRRAVVQQALSIDSAEAARLISVARKVPQQIIEAVGRAPKVGRPRWLEISELLQNKTALKNALEAIETLAFASLDSDRRFLTVFGAVAKKKAAVNPKDVETISNNRGEPIARVRLLNREAKLSIDRITHPNFAAYVVSKLPELFDAYKASDPG